MVFLAGFLAILATFWQLSTKLQAILSARKMNAAMKIMWQEILICC